MNKKKTVGIVICIVALLVVGVILIKGIKKSSAATTGFFNICNPIKEAQHEKGNSGMEGMAIWNDMVFYAKKSSFSDIDSSKFWVYNMKSGNRYPIYNGDTEERDFDVEIANDLCVTNGKYLWIASGKCDPKYINYCNEQVGIHRYTINIDESRKKVFLDEHVYYPLIREKSNGEIVSPASIQYSDEMDGFLIRFGSEVWYGNFEGRDFDCYKKFKLDNAFVIDGNRFSLGDVITQGIYYKDGILYMGAFYKDDQIKNISFIIAYPLTANSDTLLKQDTSIQIGIKSTNRYPNHFEIEAISEYEGEMIVSTNAIDANGNPCDFIGKIEGFRFDY